LGTWVSANFDFENFLEEIYEIVFRDDLDIQRKENDILTVMRGYQNNLFSNLRILLNK
jgi:hypothetical protein